MENMQIQELISALADGQLRGDAFAHAVEVAADDPSGREAWHTYHLIGDVLRSGELAASTAPAAFLARLQGRLEHEKTHQQPAIEVAQAPVVSASREAANDASFRWKLVAGFASMAAVAAISWMAVGGFMGNPEQGQLASVPSGTAVAAGQPGVMIRDPRLDEFMAAHRQLGGASALQAPAGFLRNATFDGSGR
jgi:sigma-E factor negative regulatory protein RseA